MKLRNTRNAFWSGVVQQVVVKGLTGGARGGGDGPETVTHSLNNRNPGHGQEQFTPQNQLIDSIPIQAWYLSDITTYGRVNQCHADFLGLPRRELEFKSLSDFR